MRALGLDLGTKTLGVAITDESKIIATGLDNFIYSNNDLNQCIDKIKDLFNYYDNKIDTIVLGYATYISGDKSSQTILTEYFESLLKKNFKNIKIVRQDEAYSTSFATARMKEFGLKSSKIKKIKDKAAAVLILENWLMDNYGY